MDIRQSYTAMIMAFPGGWPAMSAAMGLSRVALQNRVYDVKGQSVRVDEALAMQHLSSTTYFAEAVAAESGGVFLRLPERQYVDRDELLDKFNELYSKLGLLSSQFQAATADGEIDRRERRALADVGQEIHRTVEDLLALTFAMYCRPETDRAA